MSPENPDQPQTVPVPHDDPDWLLQSLISLVDTVPVGIGITLLVGGFLVSGQLVSGSVYFEEFAKELAAPFDAENGEKLQKLFSRHGDRYKSNPDLLPATFIHLKEARFLIPLANQSRQIAAYYGEVG